MQAAYDKSIFSRAIKNPGKGTPLWLPTGGLPAFSMCTGSHFELYFAQGHTIQDVIETLPFEQLERTPSQRLIVTMKGYRGALVFRPPSRLTLICITHSGELARWENILLKLEHLPGGFAINPVVDNPLAQFGASLLNLNWAFNLGTKIDLVKLSKCEHQITSFDPHKSSVCQVHINPNTTMVVSPGGHCAVSTTFPTQLQWLYTYLRLILKYPLDNGVSDSDEETLARWEQANPNGASLE